MQFSTARSERITAIISAIVAVIILAGGVTAYQSHHAGVEDVVQLESDFRFQLEVGFKHDARERARRLDELTKVSQAWQASPQSDNDRKLLADWLLEATIRSMPGSVEALPSVPSFGATQVEPPPVESPVLGDKSDDILIDPQSASEPLQPSSEVPTLAPKKSASALPFGKPAAADATTLPRPTALAKVKPLTKRPTAERDLTSTTSESPKTAPLPVQVNLSELAARIAGYNSGLDEIEFALSQIAVDDFSSLAKQIGKLESLARDQQFVSLYYQTLDASEQRWVEKPKDLADTLQVLQRRIDRAQSTLAGDFLGDFDTNNPDRLGKLREQLAELTSRANR